MGYKSPSKIQENVLPVILTDDIVNVIAQSQKGTGKTAAFTICMLNRVNISPDFNGKYYFIFVCSVLYLYIYIYIYIYIFHFIKIQYYLIIYYYFRL